MLILKEIIIHGRLSIGEWQKIRYTLSQFHLLRPESLNSKSPLTQIMRFTLILQKREKLKHVFYRGTSIA